mgnify:CR=1 FL=1
MNLLGWDEIPRLFVIACLAGVAITIGYIFAVYQKGPVLKQLFASADDLREALRVCRKKNGWHNPDTSSSGNGDDT